MRLRISTILCLTLFALTHAAPSRKIGESAKKDDQAPPVEQSQDPFTFMSPEDPANGAMDDCCAPGPSCANPCQQPAAPPQAYAINFAQPPPPMQPPPPPPIYTGGSCCPPGPQCSNPCGPGAGMPPPPMPMAPPMQMAPQMPMAPQMQMAPQMPMAPPMMGAPMGGPCCDPNVVQQCNNPCAGGARPAADEGEERQAYQPYPGEITFKLMQRWHDDYLDDNAAATEILKGNVEKAIKVALGDDNDNQQQMQNDYQNPYGYPGFGGGYGAPQRPQVTISNIYFREGYVPGNPSTMPITVAHVIVNGGSDDASKLQALVTPDGSLGDGLKVYKDSFSAY